MLNSGISPFTSSFVCGVGETEGDGWRWAVRFYLHENIFYVIHLTKNELRKWFLTFVNQHGQNLCQIVKNFVKNFEDREELEPKSGTFFLEQLMLKCES